MDEQTANTIASAKAHQAAERAKVYAMTGLRIQDAPFLILCPRQGCRFVGSATTDGGAVRSLAAHLVSAHVRQEQG